MYTTDELVGINRTARSGGAVGGMAMLPRIIVASSFGPDTRILDYGAGPAVCQTLKLREVFGEVTAWEIGSNFNADLHDSRALEHDYDVVMASNVLNVQPSRAHVARVIEEVANVVVPGGYAFLNLPNEPRKCEDVSGEWVKEQLELYFDTVIVVNADVSAPIFVAHRPGVYE